LGETHNPSLRLTPQHPERRNGIMSEKDRLKKWLKAEGQAPKTEESCRRGFLHTMTFVHARTWKLHWYHFATKFQMSMMDVTKRFAEMLTEKHISAEDCLNGVVQHFPGPMSLEAVNPVKTYQIQPCRFEWEDRAGELQVWESADLQEFRVSCAHMMSRYVPFRLWTMQTEATMNWFPRVENVKGYRVQSKQAGIAEEVSNLSSALCKMERLMLDGFNPKLIVRVESKDMPEAYQHCPGIALVRAVTEAGTLGEEPG